MNERTPGREQSAVIDSFLVADGAVTAWERHVTRFTRSVAAVAGPAAEAEVPGLLRRFCREVPREGRWFPRWECDGQGRLHWLLRPAPPARACLHVPAAPVPDRRHHPTVKGPDLGFLAAAVRPAQAKGYDDVLLGAGMAEATTAAIVLHTGAELVVPAGPRLPSTTLAWLAEALQAPVTSRQVTAGEVADAVASWRAWALNALHGPRRLVVGVSPAVAGIADAAVPDAAAPGVAAPDATVSPCASGLCALAAAPSADLAAARARWLADAEPLP